MKCFLISAYWLTLQCLLSFRSRLCRRMRLYMAFFPCFLSLQEGLFCCFQINSQLSFSKSIRQFPRLCSFLSACRQALFLNHSLSFQLLQQRRCSPSAPIPCPRIISRTAHCLSLLLLFFL